MASRVDATAAAAERIRREQARRGLIDFSVYVAPWYRPGAHHRLVAGVLEEVERFIRSGGKEGCGRLILEEPPRHGKSEQVSRLFPAWLLGRQPDSRVILTAYGADLAQNDSKAVRSYVTSPRYAALFGVTSTADDAVELSYDSRSKANWDLEEPHRGGVVAAGVGGGITGKGANLLVIDDPFKNRDEASSEAYRRRVMSWYRSAAYTRLEDGGAIVITHTRWDQDDLAGQMIQEMTAGDPLADQWKVIYLPALALEHYARNEWEQKEMMLRGVFLPLEDPLGRKAGEALWPAKYNREALLTIQANIGAHEFGSLYQQVPHPETGGFFQETDFEVVDQAPEKMQWYRYVDLALGESKTSDFNATVGMAMDEKTGDVFLRDMLRVHELTEFQAQLVDWMLSPGEKATIWGIEDVSFQALVMRELLTDRRLVNLAIGPVTPEGDKVSRARPLQTRARQGKVKLVRGSWTREFINEALGFPGGKHDDQVDTASGGLAMIADGILPHGAELAAFL